MEAIAVILSIIALVVAVVSVITYINIMGFSKAALTPSSSAVPEDEDRWAGHNEFEYIGNYVMQVGGTRIQIWAWRRTDRPTYFCKYIVQAGNISKTAYDLTTEFADDVSLTTADTKDSNSLPHPPGSYPQSFSGMSLEDRWNLHIESENYLMDEGGAKLEAKDTTFEQSFIRAIHRQAEYIRTLPFWPLRGAYWHFIRRSLFHNKTIRTQCEKGMIKLPNELKRDDIPELKV